MPILAVLRNEQGEQQLGLADPNGGTFDAAGDLERLIPSNDPTYRLIRQVDPNGNTVFGRLQMQDLLADIDRLQPTRPVETRGLARLRRLAELCRDGVRLDLWLIGD